MDPTLNLQSSILEAEADTNQLSMELQGLHHMESFHQEPLVFRRLEFQEVFLVLHMESLEPPDSLVPLESLESLELPHMEPAEPPVK